MSRINFNRQKTQLWGENRWVNEKRLFELEGEYIYENFEYISSIMPWRSFFSKNINNEKMGRELNGRELKMANNWIFIENFIQIVEKCYSHQWKNTIFNGSFIRTEISICAKTQK